MPLNGKADFSADHFFTGHNPAYIVRCYGVKVLHLCRSTIAITRSTKCLSEAGDPGVSAAADTSTGPCWAGTSVAVGVAVAMEGGKILCHSSGEISRDQGRCL